MNEFLVHSIYRRCKWNCEGRNNYRR